MNGNNAQLSIVAFMIALVIFILALAFAPILNDMTSDAMAVNGSSQMNSSSDTINILSMYALKTTNTSAADFKLNSLSASARENSYGNFSVTGVTYINITSSYLNNMPFNDTTNFSFVYWIYPYACGNASGVGSLNSGIIGWNFRIASYLSTSCAIQLGFRNSTYSADSGFGTLSNVTRPRIWSFVVTTYNGDTKNASIYIQGLINRSGLINTINITTPTGANSGLKIGHRDSVTGGNSNYFNGSIDEVRIYNKTLTPGEVTALYNSYSLTGVEGSPIKLAELNYSNQVAYYSFEEGMGNTSIDYSNYLYNGTNINVTYVNGNAKPFKDYTYNSTTFQLTNPSDAYRYLDLSYSWQWFNPDLGEVGGMDCSNPSSDFITAGCKTIDLAQVLFIGGLIALAGVIIAAKIIFA